MIHPKMPRLQRRSKRDISAIHLRLLPSKTTDDRGNHSARCRLPKEPKEPAEVKTYTITLRRYVDQIGGKSVTVDEPTMLYEICRTTEADFCQFVPGPVTESVDFWRRVLDAIETSHSIRCQESMTGGRHLGKRERLEMILQSRLVDTITRGLRGPGTVVEEPRPARVDSITQKSLF